MNFFLTARSTDDDTCCSGAWRATSAAARCVQSGTTKVESHAYNVHEELVNYREVGELGVHEHLLFLVLCDARGAAGQGAEQVQPNLFGEARAHIHVRRTASKQTI